MAFVKSLTRLHKGNISVYSEWNKGTEIILALPVSKEDYKKEERWTEQTMHVRLESIHHKFDQATEHEAPLPHAVNGHTSSIKQHLLVVDDNEELRQFLTESLSPFYDITTATDGQSGLRLAKEISPDLIISDVMMPGMNGMELCKIIKDDIETSRC